MKVGTQLKNVLANTWHIPTCGKCHETAKAMDQRTPQQIRDEVDMWAERLHDNARSQKWTSLIGAAVRFTDSVTHAVSGNALYRRLILDICDYVEISCKPCVYRGELHSKAPWNKSLERYRCLCENVHKDVCVIAPMTKIDIELSKGDGTAICSLCTYKEVEP